LVAIINYGVGNVGSILNMFKYIGVTAIATFNPEEIHSATHLVLPGVGSFDNGISSLEEKNLPAILNREVLANQKPILGICLGAQLMMQSSTEGSQKGLGWISGTCIQFDAASGIKVPHMGWNTLYKIHDNSLFAGLPHHPPRFYFVHSFYFSLEVESEIAASTVYGNEFTSAFRRDNIYGEQFHPEKSHKFGMQVLLNFSKVS
jgi:glutamine amidotransferase